MTNITIKTCGFSGYLEVTCHNCETLEKEIRTLNIEKNNGINAVSEMLVMSEKENKELRGLIEVSKKHLSTAYRWGLWYYENENICEEMDEDDRDDMKNDLDIVCNFLNEQAKEVINDEENTKA